MPLGPACTCFSQGKKQPAISKYFTLIFLVSQLSMMSVTDADLLNLYFSLTSSRKYGWTLLFQVYPCDSKLLAFSSCHRFLPQAPCSPVKKKKTITSISSIPNCVSCIGVQGKQGWHHAKGCKQTFSVFLISLFPISCDDCVEVY